MAVKNALNCVCVLHIRFYFRAFQIDFSQTGIDWMGFSMGFTNFIGLQVMFVFRLLLLLESNDIFHLMCVTFTFWIVQSSEHMSKKLNAKNGKPTNTLDRISRNKNSKWNWKKEIKRNKINYWLRIETELNREMKLLDQPFFFCSLCFAWL